jgi:hypothetical protein
VESLSEIVVAYPKLKIILTVSPVRHTKESLQGNSLSKSTLVVACHELTAAFPDCFYYFPAYELLLDDLRDYRFYEADLIHPNTVAIDYIWNALLSVIATPSLLDAVKEADRTRKTIHHKKHLSTS